MEYKISGKVIRGDGYGKKIGFPTVNLETLRQAQGKQELPPDGIYAGVGILEGKEYNAGIIIGPKNKVEAHLMGYTGDAYGKTVALELIKFLREYKKFDTEEELIAQIKNDLDKC